MSELSSGRGRMLTRVQIAINPNAGMTFRPTPRQPTLPLQGSDSNSYSSSGPRPGNEPERCLGVRWQTRKDLEAGLPITEKA
jgi:hypothetical protein